MLTQERLKKLLHYDPLTGIFRWKERSFKMFKTSRDCNAWNAKYAGKVAGCKRHDKRVIISIDGEIYLSHRLAWLYVHGYFPEQGIDHKDRNPSHNWISNLRPVTNQCNMRNVGNRKDSNSGVKGVSWHKKNNKWQVHIRINGKSKGIGTFTDFTEAVFHRYASEQCLDWSGCDTNSPARQWLLKNRFILK